MQVPPPASGTLYRRVATLSSWFRWLEDEDVTIGNPASRVRRPQRYATPQPWLNRNQLTDLLAAAEDEGGDVYAMACLLGLNGLRVSEACGSNIANLGGTRYQPTLRVIGKGDKPAEIVLNPRTQQAVDQAIDGRSSGPLLRNQWNRRMQPHNAAAALRRVARTAGITSRVTPTRYAAPTSPSACSKASPSGTCNALLATPRPIPPSPTTNPKRPSTRTPPSCSWPPPLDDASSRSRRLTAIGLGRRGTLLVPPSMTGLWTAAGRPALQVLRGRTRCEDVPHGVP